MISDRDSVSADFDLHPKFEFKRFPVSVGDRSVFKSAIDCCLKALCNLRAPRKRQREIIQSVKISQIFAYLFFSFVRDKPGIFRGKPIRNFEAFGDRCI